MESTISIGGDKKEAGASSKGTASYFEFDNGSDDDDEEEDDEDASSGTPRMRCILCTTAAGWLSVFFFCLFGCTIVLFGVCIYHEHVLLLFIR